MQCLFAACLSCFAWPAPVPAAGEEPVLSLEVLAPRKDGKPAVPKYPKHYEKFEKQIARYEGKPVLDLLGTKLTLRPLNGGPTPRKHGKPYTGLDFARAILGGRIVPDAEMRYDLQSAQECSVKTPDGEFKVGIFYPPVGYVVTPDGEAYWFLFDKPGR